MTSLTDHQKNWWGTQRCRRCNAAGSTIKRPESLRPICPDCDGSGWTEWAALATEAWTEIVPNLWIGGHDFNYSRVGGQYITSAKPGSIFDVVVSAYAREGFEPDTGVDHHLVRFEDGRLTGHTSSVAENCARIVEEEVSSGKKVLVRCQAGLNRSSLIAGIALVLMGYSGKDAVQVIRAKRSPWALCNDDYEQFIVNYETPIVCSGLLKGRGSQQ